MPALIAADHRDRTINAMERLRETFLRRRRSAERFAMHAAIINDKETAAFFSHNVKVWDEAIDEVTLRLQVEQGL